MIRSRLGRGEAEIFDWLIWLDFLMVALALLLGWLGWLLVRCGRGSTTAFAAKINGADRTRSLRPSLR
ncbi:MAG: hypothetical protein HGA45_37110 [Chloroflexales bacterium]|nr:hypothetical protein [Chloroflexales bacterium]